MQDPPDDTWVDRTWMAYSRSALLVIAVGALLARGAYLRDLPMWMVVSAAVPSLALGATMLARMRAISRGRLHASSRMLLVMCALVIVCALLGAFIALLG